MMAVSISPTLTQRLTEWFNTHPESKTGSGELAKTLNIPVDRISDGLKKLFDRGLLHRCEVQRKGQRMTYVYWKKSIESAPPKPYKPATTVRREIKSVAAVASPATGKKPGVHPVDEGAKSPASPNPGSQVPDTSFQIAPAGGLAVDQPVAVESSSSAATANVIEKLQNENRVMRERGDLLAHAIVEFCEWLPQRIPGRVPMNLHEAQAMIRSATETTKALGYLVKIIDSQSDIIGDKSRAMSVAEELARNGERVAVAAVVAKAESRVEWSLSA